MNIYEKMVELKSFVLQEGLNKDKKGFNFTYVTGNQILAKVGSKMTELRLLLIPSSKLGTYEQYDYKNAKNVDKTEFIVKGEMTFTWINAEKPEQNIVVDWAYYGQQEDVPKAYGSGLTYAERYYLLKFLGVPTDQDDPDARNNAGYAKPIAKPIAKPVENIQDLICSGCGMGIKTAVKTFSMQKYGKPLCMDCQKKQ